MLNSLMRIMRDTINYDSILEYKTLLNAAKEKGEKKVTVRDFLVLSSGNDPFYAGSTNGKKWGEWFATLWREHKGHEARVHVRGLHYALVGRTSSDSPVYMPDGKVYENTEKCWKRLEQAGKYARYNGFIEAEKFEDRRAQTFVERPYAASYASISCSDPTSSFEIEFPGFPKKPTYYLSYGSQQRYRLEVWCEKSTQETVLSPIAEHYNVSMLSAQGELSISAMVKAIQRAENTPTRILYISDFDPAGRSMPVAASRKLEFLQGLLHSKADIQLYPIALTHEQCVAYELERTPIKEKEKRRPMFEARYGSGATELDALEAKHPGELAQLLEREILKFHDDTLWMRTHQANMAIHRDLSNLVAEIQQTYDAASLESEYAQLEEEFLQWRSERWAPFQERLENAWQGIKADLEERMPDIEAYDMPSGKEVDAGEHCLYDSQREYLQQIAAYGDFTGKFSHLIDGDDDEDETA